MKQMSNTVLKSCYEHSIMERYDYIVLQYCAAELLLSLLISLLFISRCGIVTCDAQSRNITFTLKTSLRQVFCGEE
jgi:hypothetical protein